MAELPEAFLNRMQQLLGGQYPAFLSSYEESRWYGLRVNTLKLTAEEFEQASSFNLRPIPWVSDGFYYEENERPGKHPYYHAGLYYIQEPSAMAPGEIIGAVPGDRVLDICAAPGGKSTQLAAKLRHQGLLVTNDINSERVKALVRNVELFGARQAVVMNESPNKLAERFAGFFDKILVDAPCSGEGMFRKDNDMSKAWSKHSSERCIPLQRDILKHAADMLAPGGTLLYSTCTFAVEENEAMLLEFLNEHTDFKIDPIKAQFGYRQGRPDWIDDLHVPDKPESAATPLNSPHPENLYQAAKQSLAGTVRLWPHHIQGEGHFVARFIKQAEEAADSSWNTGSLDEPDTANEAPKAESTASNAKLAARDAAPLTSVKSRFRSASGIALPAEEDEGDALSYLNFTGDSTDAEGTERRHGKAAKDKKRKGRRKGKGQAKPRRRPENDRLPEALRQFCEQELLGKFYGIVQAFAEHVYLVPRGLPSLDGLKVSRPGWYLGKMKKDRFVPSQALAMGLERRLVKRYISLDADSVEAERYLRGETLQLNSDTVSLNDSTARKEGLCLMCLDGYPVGWGKWNGGMLKNEYPPSWRRL